ncbi:MAG: gamma-glutamylcyclotransferase [Myxococcota bacterium]
MRFFAYGSNLDDADLRAFARARGLERALPRARGRAYLPDHALRFHYHSPARGGGALDVVPAPGGLVPGALFTGGPETAALLDAKEGVAAGRYRRARVVVLTESGRAHEATTYRVCAPRKALMRPTADYAALCRRGYGRFGLDPAPLRAAEAGEEAAATSSLFVYGTLREGSAQGPGVRGPRRPARARGQLRDLGDYPGLVPFPGWVAGESVFLGSREEAARVFAELDEYEDFLGWDRLGASLYHRGVARLESGGIAWAYVLRQPAGRPLPSGDWRVR